MKLLAVDTATASCGVALLDDGQLLAEAWYGMGATHSRHLMAMIQEVLGRCACTPSRIDGIAVTRGPGTFTGLRIGISTVKGLAAATGAPVVGVSSLAALAYPLALLSGPVFPMIDARRGELYTACYRRGVVDGTARVHAPVAVAAELPADAVLVGSGALLYRDLFAERCPGVRFADAGQHVIRAASVGLLALARFSRGETDAVATLVPDYIRASDAQVHHTGK